MRPQRHLFLLSGLLLVLFHFYRAVAFTLSQWGKPWPHPVLTIDGNSYLEGARRLAAGESIFSMADTYHSPAYQWWLSVLLGTGDVVAASKICALLFFALALWLTFRLAKKYFSSDLAVVAIVIFSGSLSWVYYANMIQYEILVGFLLLAWASLEFSERSEISGVLAGALLCLLILFHARFAALLVIPLYRLLKGDRRRGDWLSLAVTLTPVFLWCALYSLKSGQWIWVMERRDLLFRLGNNPNALGVGYPHPMIVEPSGWAFVLQRPAHFFWLVGERFQYLWGIQPDVWAVPPEGMGRTGWEPTLDLVGCILVFAGLAVSLRRSRWPFYLLLAATLLPSLMIFGNKRTLVPVIPFLAIFQAAALLALKDALYSLSAVFSRMERKTTPSEPRT